jgi:aspartate racemase
MKTIGMIGGMSWESTATYYTLINRAVQQKLGGLHSAKLILVSVDFAEIEALQMSGNWSLAAEKLSEAARALEKAGADFFIICTNTMHLVADIIAANVSIPLLHIADATARELKHQNVTRVGLLGTQFTMQEPFYKDRLQNQFSIEVIVPTPFEQQMIHQVIYDELCLGKILDVSRHQYIEIISGLAKQGAQGIILGCTEIALLVQQRHTKAQLFDTTSLHATTAVDFALSDKD